MARGNPKAHPVLKKNPIAFKLPQWIIEWLRDQPISQGKTVEMALIAHYNLKEPDLGMRREDDDESNRRQTAGSVTVHNNPVGGETKRTNSRRNPKQD